MKAALPGLQALTRTLRALHAAWAHPEAGGDHVRLVCHISGGQYRWDAVAAGSIDSLWLARHALSARPLVFGEEFVPGDGAPFDAVAAARRLLAAVRDGYG